MNRKLAWCVGLALLGLSGLVVAQDIIPQVSNGQDVLVPNLPTANQEAIAHPEVAHNFTIIESPSHGATILLDKATGETWHMKTIDNEPNWVSMRRINIKDGPGFKLPDDVEQAPVNAQVLDETAIRRIVEGLGVNREQAKERLEKQIDVLTQQLKELREAEEVEAKRW